MLNLRSRIQDALASRRETYVPSIFNLIGIYAVGIGLFLFLCYTGSPPQAREYQFASEKGSLTAASSIFLAMASAFSAAAFHFSKQRKTHKSLFWLTATLGFFFLSFDELMRIHEFVGMLLREEVGAPAIFRNWNDAIVIGYGIAAFVAVFVFLPEVLRYPKFAELFVAAFGFFVLHTAVDALAEPQTTTSAIIEESAKLLCSASLSLAAFVGFLAVAYDGKNYQDRGNGSS